MYTRRTRIPRTRERENQNVGEEIGLNCSRNSVQQLYAKMKHLPAQTYLILQTYISTISGTEGRASNLMHLMVHYLVDLVSLLGSLRVASTVRKLLPQRRSCKLK